MLQAGGEPNLALEALRAERSGQPGIEHLERNRSLVPKILGQPHGGRASPSQLALEQVAAAQSLLELGARVGHRESARKKDSTSRFQQ